MDLRVVGVVLSGIGALVTLATLSPLFEARIVGGLGFLLLLAPGVWFILAASMIRRGSLPIVRWSLCIAVAQVTLVVLSAVAGLLFFDRRGGPPVCMPAGLLLFFFPAEIALLVQLFRARAIIRASEMARGFEVGRVQQAILVDENRR